MRHFLRVDGSVSVGPSLGAVVYVESGETLHLDETDPAQAQVADDISRHSSGWVEVDGAGAAVAPPADRAMPDARRHRFISATPEVTQVAPDVIDIGVEPEGPQPIGEQPPEHLDETV